MRRNKSLGLFCYIRVDLSARSITFKNRRTRNVNRRSTSCHSTSHDITAKIYRATYCQVIYIQTNIHCETKKLNRFIFCNILVESFYIEIIISTYRGLKARTHYLAKFVKIEFLVASCQALRTLPEKNSLSQNSHSFPLFKGSKIVAFALCQRSVLSVNARTH